MESTVDNTSNETTDLRNRKGMGALTATKQSMNEIKDELAKRVSNSPYLQSAVLFITKFKPLFEALQRVCKNSCISHNLFSRNSGHSVPVPLFNACRFETPRFVDSAATVPP
jgi:hypothetical protein